MFYLHDMQLGPSQSFFFAFSFFLFCDIKKWENFCKKKLAKLIEFTLETLNFLPQKTQIFFLKEQPNLSKEKWPAHLTFGFAIIGFMFDSILSCRLQSIFYLIFAI